MSVQRATPSGPTAHTPEQQLASTAHGSPAGAQPRRRAQRFAAGGSAPVPATHAPEQQSLALLQLSSATRHPGNIPHVGDPAEGGAGGAMGPAGAGGPVTQRLEQQSLGAPHVSPCTRQRASNAQRPRPPSPGVQAPAQHSGSIMQLSPAARHAWPLGPHIAAAQLPPQHSVPLVQRWVSEAHNPAAQVPRVGSQKSEQQAPARVHGSPIEEQPLAARQTEPEAAPCPQMNEQQSVPAAHA